MTTQGTKQLKFVRTNFSKLTKGKKISNNERGVVLRNLWNKAKKLYPNE